MKTLNYLKAFLISLVFTVTPLTALSQTTFLEDSFNIFYGDVDGDGLNDIYLQANDKIIFLAHQNNTPIVFQDMPSLLLPGHATGISNPIDYSDQEVDVSYLNPDAYQIYISDVDGDGYEDLEIIGSENLGVDHLIVYGSTNDLPYDIDTFIGGPDYYAPGERGTNFQPDSYDVYYGDLNSDGIADIYLKAIDKLVFLAHQHNTPILYQDAPSVVLLGSGDSNGFTSPIDYSDIVVDTSNLTLNPYNVTSSDVDGDGANDLILDGGLTLGTLTLYGERLGFPSLFTYIAPDYQNTDSNYSQDQFDVYYGDITGDGIADLYLKARNPNEPSLLLTGNGEGFGTPTIYNGHLVDTSQLQQGTHSLSIADTNGDGIADLILDGSGSNNGSVTVFGHTNGSPSLVQNQTSTNPNVVEVVGSTKSSFNVSNGVASYSVPISVPPGRGGMQPDLSLIYSSAGGNGVLGHGWNLGGLSGIGRCTATIEQDGFVGRINFDGNDRFCLDGQRLIPVSGAYGAVGTEYRTEIDTYQKIVSVGGTQNNPDHFNVYTKSGLRKTYGLNENSKLNTPHGVLNWSIYEINDSTNNNPIYFNYTHDRNNQYLQFIEYAGGRIDFSYETRPASVITYFKGSSTEMALRLNQISVSSSEQQVKTYNFEYLVEDYFSRSLHQSLLTKIRECNPNNECYKPIQFNWSADNYGGLSTLNEIPSFMGGLTPQRYSLLSNSSLEDRKAELARIRFGDFNADGITDIYTIRGVDNVVQDDLIRLFNPDGTFQIIGGIPTAVNTDSAELSQLSTARLQFGDFNGDGRTDIYYFHGNGGAATDTIYLTQPDGSFHSISGLHTDIPSNIAEAHLSISRYKFADFNGDGRTDIYEVVGRDHEGTAATYYHNPQYIEQSAAFLDRIHYSNGDGSFSENFGLRTYIPGDLAQAQIAINRLKFADLNGDGITDLYHVLGFGSEETDKIYLFNGRTNPVLSYEEADGLTSYVSSDISHALIDLSRFNFGDFNADRLVDIYYSKKDGGQDTIYLSKGITGWGHEPFKGFQPIDGLQRIDGSTEDSIRRSIAGLRFQDFNGDGKTDIYRFSSADYLSDSVYLSKGDGTYRIISNITELGAENHRLNPHFNGEIEEQLFGLSKVQFADFNGDGKLDVYQNDWWGETGTENIIGNQTQHTHVTSIQDAYNNQTTVSYMPITNPEVYNKDNFFGWPIREAQGPQHVVRQVISNNGVGGTNTANYRYESFRAHMHGRGSHGYSKIFIDYPETGKTSETTFEQTGFPRVGQVLTQTERLGETIINFAENFYAYRQNSSNDNIIGIDLTQSNQTSYELDGSEVIRVETYNQNIDDFGNIGLITINTTGNNETFTKITNSVFNNYPINWHLGRLQESTVTHQSPNQPDVIRRSVFTYDTSSGLLNTELIVGNSGSILTTTVYGHDAFGQKTSTTVSASGYTDRSSSTEYNALGQVTRQCNVYNQCETFSYTPEGWLKSTTGPNGITTQWEYDGFGRKLAEHRADGTSTTFGYHFISDSDHCGLAATHAVLCATSQITGFKPNIVQSDALGREVRKISQTFDGRQAFTDTQYNARALVSQTSRPYYPGEPTYWATSEYDDLDRIRLFSEPAQNGERRDIITDYNGLETITTAGALGYVTITRNNAIGQTVYKQEEEGAFIDYTYTSDGNLKTTVVAGNTDTTITLHYDEFGRKVAMDDPDMGHWEYVYSPFGELIQQTDAKGQVTTMQYDLLGRMTQRSEAEGTSTWVYGDNNAAPGSVGKLLSESGLGLSRTFIYDRLGRATSSTTNIEGQGSFTTKTHYDTLGRVSRVEYPGQEGFFTENNYNENGFLFQVRGLRTQAQQPTMESVEHVDPDENYLTYWKVINVDASGRITAEVYGNGIRNDFAYDAGTGQLMTSQSSLFASQPIRNLEYTYDGYNNVENRLDYVNDIQESYVYDRLDRLESNTVSSGSHTGFDFNQTQTLTYDVLGNIQNKSDVGAYEYGEGNAGPHAVTRAGNQDYSYDLNGNMIAGNGRSLVWSSFNKPTQMIRNGKAATFSYGPNHSRYKKVNHKGEVTLYVGGLYEQVAKSGKLEKKFYISAGGKMVAEHIISSDEGIMTRYMHSDALGSIDTITDNLAEVVDRRSYDAWGKLRDFDWRAGETTTALSYQTELPFTNKAYTGHENIQEVDLIHMNGRVYDATLARFVSADPHIQAGSMSQSYNRYSYVLNNPMKYTDPSGYFFSQLNKVRKQLRPYATIIASIIVFYFCPPCGASMMNAALTGAAIGAAGAVVNGGNIFRGAITGALSGMFMGNHSLQGAELYAAKAIAGGASAVINGGKFGQGFISAGFASWAGGKKFFGNDPAGKVLQSTLVGGTASKIGGGKFANGATTSAFYGTVNYGAQILKERDNHGPIVELMDGKVHLAKYGSKNALLSELEISTVENSLTEIFKNGGDNGLKLRDAILSSKRPTKIILNDLSSAAALEGEFILTLDLENAIRFYDYSKGIPVDTSPTRILAHELSHAVLNIEDGGPYLLPDFLGFNSYPAVEFTDSVMKDINGSIRKYYSNGQHQFKPKN